MGLGPRLWLSMELKLHRPDCRLQTLTLSTEQTRSEGRNPFFRLIVRRRKKWRGNNIGLVFTEYFQSDDGWSGQWSHGEEIFYQFPDCLFCPNTPQLWSFNSNTISVRHQTARNQWKTQNSYLKAFFGTLSKSLLFNLSSREKHTGKISN